MTASQLAQLVGGRVVAGREDVSVSGVAALEDATPNDATFFGNEKYLPALRQSKAGVALVPDDFSESLPDVGAVVAVANPSLAFAAVVAALQPPLPPLPPGIHPTAVISPSAKIGRDASVHAYAVIEDGAEIGAGSSIGAHTFVGRESRIGPASFVHPHVIIRERVSVGSRCVVHSGTVIGGDGFGFETVNGRHVKVPQVGGVEIGDDVEIGAGVTIDRARFGMTRIGEGTKIDNLVQIAHNVVIGPHCLIVAQAGISGSTRLGKYVVLAGQVGVVGHITLGDGATVGAQSGVSKSVPAGAKVFGSPAEPMMEAAESLARVRRLPKLIERVKQLEAEVTRLRAELGGKRP
jgi:UDP-3-O-[3-hydroxymyristoyl] glucosamine N-acyltransferase